MNTTESELQMPLIHSNGNSGTALGNQYFEALRGLQDFEHKLYAVEFHRRDYYPLGDEAWNVAVEQRNEIKKKISDIRYYLEAHSVHCFNSAR